MRFIALLLTLALAGCGPDLDPAIEAYQEGRFDDARHEFARVGELSLDGGPLEAVYGRALAALQAGDLRDADAAVHRLTEEAGGELAMLAGFLRGNVEFARCELAEQQAGAAEAEPFAYDLALVHVEKARRAWQAAAVTREDWPAARRNVERALRKRVELRRKKAEKQDRNRTRRDPRVRPQPAQPETAPEADPEQPSENTAPVAELPPDQVLDLLERLTEKEREKTGGRETRRAARQTGVERDW